MIKTNRIVLKGRSDFSCVHTKSSIGKGDEIMKADNNILMINFLTHKNSLANDGLSDGELSRKIAKCMNCSLQQTKRIEGALLLVAPFQEMVRSGEVGLSNMQPIWTCTHEEQFRIYNEVKKLMEMAKPFCNPFKVMTRERCKVIRDMVQNERKTAEEIWPCLNIVSETFHASSIKKEKTTKKTSLENLDKLTPYESGKQYTDLVAQECARIGLDVLSVRYTKDKGGDIIVSRRGTRVGIQCKFSRKENGIVPMSALYEAFYTKNENCDIQAVVSNARYTQSIRERADESRIRLWKIEDLEYHLG